MNNDALHDLNQELKDAHVDIPVTIDHKIDANTDVTVVVDPVKETTTVNVKIDI